jgi:rare lipoprotein A
MSRKARLIRQGLQTRSSISIMLVMDRENQAGGQTKCRKFTNLVNVHRIRPVVSTTPAGDYCVPTRRGCTDVGMIDGNAIALHQRFRQYLSVGVWQRLLQRGLPGLAATALLALVHSGAHAQRAAATAPEGWIGQTGTASYYGRAHQGRRTASGGRFDENELTAAHPWLPFGSKVRVTLQGTGHSVVVTITDRLYSARRVIDLSMAAARLLGMVRQGVGTVSLSPV